MPVTHMYVRCLHLYQLFNSYCSTLPVSPRQYLLLYFTVTVMDILDTEEFQWVCVPMHTVTKDHVIEYMCQMWCLILATYYFFLELATRGEYKAVNISNVFQTLAMCMDISHHNQQPSSTLTACLCDSHEAKEEDAEEVENRR